MSPKSTWYWKFPTNLLTHCLLLLGTKWVYVRAIHLSPSYRIWYIASRWEADCFWLLLKWDQQWRIIIAGVQGKGVWIRLCRLLKSKSSRGQQKPSWCLHSFCVSVTSGLISATTVAPHSSKTGGLRTWHEYSMCPLANGRCLCFFERGPQSVFCLP